MSRDGIYAGGAIPSGPFEFNDAVARVFPDTLRRSIPGYAETLGAIGALAARAVRPGTCALDIGCGNGYFALRMRAAGARAVVGLDPTLLYLTQFRPSRTGCARSRSTCCGCTSCRRAHAPSTPWSPWGVLYHQRSPEEHLQQLRDALRPGGERVLETLILPGDKPAALAVEGRYARMRNVWLLPTLPLLQRWVREAGFTAVRTADVSTTTPAEQRRTEWMPFESLAEALLPNDPARTIEGWPAPRRALLIGVGPT